MMKLPVFSVFLALALSVNAEDAATNAPAATTAPARSTPLISADAQRHDARVVTRSDLLSTGPLPGPLLLVDADSVASRRGPRRLRDVFGDRARTDRG